MLLLVNNLMDIQKYEAGKTILQKTRFNFSAFIQEMYHSFESVANNREITFTLENELPDSYRVCFDEAEIEKIFFNLLSNAFKFNLRRDISPFASALSRRPNANCSRISLPNTIRFWWKVNICLSRLSILEKVSAIRKRKKYSSRSIVHRKIYTDRYPVPV